MAAYPLNAALNALNEHVGDCRACASYLSDPCAEREALLDALQAARKLRSTATGPDDFGSLDAIRADERARVAEQAAEWTGGESERDAADGAQWESARKK